MNQFTKKTLLLSVVIIFTLQLHAQTEQFVVSADNMNVLYFGIENPISIAAQGFDCDNLDVSVTNGTITGSNGKYIVKPGSEPISTIVVLAEAESGEIKKIGCDTFRVKRIPTPQACIGNHCCNNLYLTKAELLSNPKVNVLWHFPFELKFEVISFSVSYVENKSVITKVVNGNKFTQEIIDAIKNLEGGSKIFFQDIKVSGPDGTRILSSIDIMLADKG